MIRIEKFKETQSLNRGSQEIKLTVPLNTGSHRNQAYSPFKSIL